MKNAFLLCIAVHLLFAQDNNSTLFDAFSKGKVLGNITLFSYHIDEDNTDDAYATAFGGFLKYTTDDTRSFFASARFHQSSAIGADKNKERTLLFNNDKEGSNLTALSESFLAYRYQSLLLKAGNMMLSTPMMNDDTTRIVPWSYRGAAFSAEPFADTIIQINHITHIRENTSHLYQKESASGAFEKGISLIGITYEAVENVSFQSYYYYAPELYSTFAGQLDYKYVMNEDNLFCLGLQYFKSGHGGKYNDRTSRNGGDDIDLIAFKAGIDANNWESTLYYSQNFGLSGIVKGYGGLSKVYTTSMVANGRGSFKPETWMLKSHYDLDPFAYGQSEFAIWLSHTRVKDPRGDNFNAYYTHIRHFFNADTSAYLRFEAIDYMNGNKHNTNYLRLIASYDF